jgi:hypothetical protein
MAGHPMRTPSHVPFLVLGLFLLMGCDQIYRRRVILDFRQPAPVGFTVSRPGDLDVLLARIEGIAIRHGLKCQGNGTERTSYVCRAGTVALSVQIRDGQSVSIELTQFGPWRQTAAFQGLERDLSAFLADAFPGQQLRLTK